MFHRACIIYTASWTMHAIKTNDWPRMHASWTRQQVHITCYQDGSNKIHCTLDLRVPFLTSSTDGSPCDLFLQQDWSHAESDAIKYLPSWLEMKTSSLSVHLSATNDTQLDECCLRFNCCATRHWEMLMYSLNAQNIFIQDFDVTKCSKKVVFFFIWWKRFCDCNANCIANVWLLRLFKIKGSSKAKVLGCSSNEADEKPNKSDWNFIKSFPASLFVLPSQDNGE